MTSGLFHGWRVVATCFVISAVACSLCLFGASVYLQALTSLHHWPIAEVSSAITVYYLVSASSQRLVGRGIDQWGPRPVLTIGTLAMALGVALTGRVSQPWQLYPCFALIGIGWACLSATGVSATVAPWFERHQGRSITLALMGSSLGAIVGVPLRLKAIDARGVGLPLKNGKAMKGPARCLYIELLAREEHNCVWVTPEELAVLYDGKAAKGQPKTNQDQFTEAFRK